MHCHQKATTTTTTTGANYASISSSPMRRAVVVRITLRPAAARPAPRPSPIAVVSGRNKAIAAGHQHAKSSSADATAVRFDHGRSHQLAVPHHQLIADVLHAAPKFGPREEKVRVAGLGRAGQLRFRGRGLGAARTHAAAGGRRSNGAGRAPAGGASSAGRRADEAPPAIRNGGGHDDGTTLHALADGRPSARRGESWRGTRPTRAEMTGHASHQSMTEAARVEAFPWLPEHVAAAAVQAEAICIALFDSQRLVASLQKLFVLGRAALLLALLAGAVRSPPDTLFKLIKDAAWLMAASVPVEALAAASVAWLAVMPLVVMLRRTSQDASRAHARLMGLLESLMERERAAAAAAALVDHREAGGSADEPRGHQQEEDCPPLLEPSEERALAVQLAHHRNLVRISRQWLKKQSSPSGDECSNNTPGNTFAFFGKTIEWAAAEGVITPQQQLEYMAISVRGTLVKHNVALLDLTNEFTLRAPRPLRHVSPAPPAPAAVVADVLHQVAEHRRLLAELVGGGVEVPACRRRKLRDLINFAEANDLITLERASELRRVDAAGGDAKHTGF